ncbi:hypothetical protein E4T39_07997 [Aureobasidium subglaciale]|nr:hypothetical protein E4T39_07997 [Aureobasidium subglaciale]
MASTTQARRFVCPKCGTATDRKEGMKSHIINMHEPALEVHTLAVHKRRLLPGENVGDVTILDRVKAEADASEVTVAPPLAQVASTSSHALPAPPAALAPARNPTVALPPPLRPAPEQPSASSEPASRPLAVEAPNPDDADQKMWSMEDEPEPIPGYYHYYGAPYGTGPDIPGGRRQ